MFDFSGATALVTGASAGIGEATARLLAARGTATLVLVARDAERLDALAAELREERIRVETVPLDLAEPGAPARLKAATDALGLQVDVLVNDAGAWSTGPFAGTSPEFGPQPGEETSDRMIALNVAALTGITESYLPGMVERGGGGIVNMGSTSAFQPFPYSAVYGATKAFVLSFTLALWAELNDRGIEGVRLACVNPGIIASANGKVTGLLEDPLAKIGVGTPEEVAVAIMNALDESDPAASPVRMVGRAHAVAAFAGNHLPKPLVASALARVRRDHALNHAHTVARGARPVPASLLRSALPVAAFVGGYLVLRSLVGDRR